jgi:hypothetical protein
MCSLNLRSRNLFIAKKMKPVKSKDCGEKQQLSNVLCVQGNKCPEEQF